MSTLSSQLNMAQRGVDHTQWIEQRAVCLPFYADEKDADADDDYIADGYYHSEPSTNPTEKNSCISNSYQFGEDSLVGGPKKK